MKCKECKFKSDLVNTKTTGKAVCTFVPSYLSVDVENECCLRNISAELTDFHFIMDELPDNFEECLIVLRDGGATVGCWDEALYPREGGELGGFRNSRGGMIPLSCVWAWLPIEKYRVDL